jgi:hypothetical protein
MAMWRLGAGLTLIFFVIQVAVLAGSRIAHPNERPDPFALYKAMMPGALAMGSENPVCNFQTESGSSPILRCELQPHDSFFVSGVSNIADGRFVYSSLIPNHLYIGDVIRHWGRPDIVERISNRSFYVQWYDPRLIGVIDPVGPLARFSYMLPIERLIIALQSPDEP